MTIDEAIKQVIPNPDSVLKRFSNERDLMEMFFLKFPNDKSVTAFRESAGTQNWSQIEIDAHTLKGVAGNMGFDGLFGLTSTVVTSIREKNIDAAIETLPKALSEPAL